MAEAPASRNTWRHARAAMRQLWRLCIVVASQLVAQPIRADETLPATDWPVYRHDRALSGVTRAKGRITRPAILAEYYLGPPRIELVATADPSPRVVDLDGDGKAEQFAISGSTIRVTDLEGRELWSHTVEESALGDIVRVCRLFPDRVDRQIIVFSHRMDTGEGQGYCFSFAQGVRRGKLAWTTGPLTGYHAPTLIVDDVDADGVPEIVVAPHYRVQIFDGQTGRLETEVPWDVGRNYGTLLSRTRPGYKHKDIFIVCDFVLHVDCIRFENGAWKHAWGHKYVEPNAPAPRGRQMYLRVGPNPVVDLDADGRDEMAYMIVDGAADDTWHLRIRDCESGEVRADLAGIWVWSIADLDRDGRTEIIYTPTQRKRPRTFCDLHVGRYDGKGLTDVGVVKNVAPAVTQVRLPLEAHSIADEGRRDLVRIDTDGNGSDELLVGKRGSESKVRDVVTAVEPTAAGEGPRRVWSLAIAGHQLELVEARRNALDELRLRVRDRTAGKVLDVSAQGKVVGQSDLGEPGGFSTVPIAVDLNGDGRSEIIVQNAAGEIVALGVGQTLGEPLEVLWSRPGVSMNRSPGYARNGGLCPQAADLDGDGLPEVVFATEDEQGLAALRAVDAGGRIRWTRSFPGCAWGGLQAGVNLWTFGRFGGRQRGLDVYVDVHRRNKGSSEGWVLDGETGRPLWHERGLVAEAAAMPLGGGMPAVADVNDDGIDDLVQEFYTIYGAISGRDGQPLFPPASLPSAEYFGRWIAYSWPTVVDLNGDGKLEAYLNSASYARGGYAAVHIDGKPLWAEFHDNRQGSNGFGPVGDFDGDGLVEIGIGVLDGTLLCLNGADGTRKWTTKQQVVGDIVAGDINDDGIAELVWCGADGKIHAVSGADGREVWAVAASGTPIIADVDGDGWVEIVAAGADGKLRIIGQRND